MGFYREEEVIEALRGINKVGEENNM